MDGEAFPIHVFMLTTKETFNVFYSQPSCEYLDEFPVKDVSDLSWYLGCAFEHDKVKGVEKLIRWLRVSVYSMSRRLHDCRYGSCVDEKVEKEGDWPYK